MVRNSTKQAVLTGLFLGSIVLAGLGGPSRAEASHEKWWTPDRGEGYRSERVYRRKASPRRFDRQLRSWRGQRIYRDVIVIRSGYRGPRYRAWRAYSRPEYIYSQRIIRVRPVRFHVAASIVIGGVHVRGSYVDPGDYDYGCNFCDARFSDYAGYHAHVMGCSHRPAGYRVECHDWDASGAWGDDGWRDDDGRYEDGRYGDGGYDRGHRHDDGCDHEDDDRYDDDYDR